MKQPPLAKRPPSHYRNTTHVATGRVKLQLQQNKLVHKKDPKLALGAIDTSPRFEGHGTCVRAGSLALSLCSIARARASFCVFNLALPLLLVLTYPAPCSYYNERSRSSTVEAQVREKARKKLEWSGGDGDAVTRRKRLAAKRGRRASMVKGLDRKSIVAARAGPRLHDGSWQDGAKMHGAHRWG